VQYGTLKTAKKVLKALRNLKRFFPRAQTRNPLYETFLDSVERKMVPQENTKPLRFYTEPYKFLIELQAFLTKPKRFRISCVKPFFVLPNLKRFRTKGFEFVSRGRTFLGFVAPSKPFLPFLGFLTAPIFFRVYRVKNSIKRS
jgi:hypothetical protein